MGFQVQLPLEEGRGHSSTRARPHLMPLSSCPQAQCRHSCSLHNESNPRTTPSTSTCQALRPMRKYTTEGTDTIQPRALTRSCAHRPQSRVQHPSEVTRAARNMTPVEAWVQPPAGTTATAPCSLPQGIQGILPTPYQTQKKRRQKEIFL